MSNITNQLHQQILGSFSHNPTVTGDVLIPLSFILFVCDDKRSAMLRMSTFMLISVFQSL